MNNDKLGLLDNIQYPSDLRRLDVAQLPRLCAELRRDIVEELAENPGHLASSLGVVELTVALHYVFSTGVTILLHQNIYLYFLCYQPFALTLHIASALPP